MVKVMMFRRRPQPSPNPLVDVVNVLVAVNASQAAEIEWLRGQVDGWCLGWNYAQERWLRAEAEAEGLASVAMGDALARLNDNE